MLRKLRFAVAFVLLMPLAAHAENDVAVVQASRTAWLNGSVIPQLSAIFPGDIVQTKADLADIDAFGSKVRIWKDSLLTYRTNAVELERGGISVITSKALATQIEGLTVRPAALAWTEFQVTNSDGAVHILATKGDLLVADDSGTTTLNAGQETTREVPNKKRKKRAAGAPPAAVGSPMDSKIAIIGATAAITGVTTWVLCQSDDPISPDPPRGGCN
jgi:hypothetical protein